MPDNVTDWVTIPKEEYMELISKKLNYEHLVNAMLSKCEIDYCYNHLEFDSAMISHILCAFETDRYYRTLDDKRRKYKEERERILNAYGNNQSNQ